jgi:integral membrane protein
MNTSKLLSRFRAVAIAEGISFLVLLGIAMPLKYLADFPLGVTVVGWAHGVLFVAYLAIAFEVKMALNKNFWWYVKAFIASILPFGTFILEKQMRKEATA